MELSEKLAYLGVVLPNLTLLQPRRKSRHVARAVAAGNRLRAHWHEKWPEDPQLLDSWERLVRSRPTSTAFHSPAWQSALARPFIRARRFRLLTIFEDDRVVGVLPLRVNPGGVLETVGAMMSDHLDPTIADRKAVSIWASCMHAICCLPGINVRRVILHNIREQSLNHRALSSAASETGFEVLVEQVGQTARVPLPRTWLEYLAGLAGHDRKEVRRKLRKAETKAAAELVIARYESHVRSGLERVFAFMREAGGTRGIKARWTYRPIFDRVAADLTRSGLLEVHLLRLQGRDAAGLICFPSHDGPLIWAVGYDHSMKKWSPGIVLFAQSLKRAIAQGAAYFDLLRGQQRYKSELGAVDSPLYRITLERDNH